MNGLKVRGIVMGNVIVILILAALVAGIIRYLIRKKKQEGACMGCPYAKQCGGSCSGRNFDNKEINKNKNRNER